MAWVRRRLIFWNVWWMDARGVISVVVGRGEKGTEVEVEGGGYSGMTFLASRV